MENKRLPTSKRRSAIRDRRRQQESQVQRKRLLITLGVILAAVLVVGGLIAYGISQQPKPTTSTNEIIKVPTQTVPLADGTAVGPANAKVVVTEFADFQCPNCKTFHDSVGSKLVQDYASTGRVRFEFKNFIVIDGNIGGTESRDAANAALCANEQGKFWDYYNTLYANQGSEGSGVFAPARLKTYAVNVGLDATKFNSCLDAKKFDQQVTTDEGLARSLGLNGTPSLLINNKLVNSPFDYAALTATLEKAIKDAGQ